MKIKIDDWKKFEISELFTYERGKESAPKQNPDGDCRLLSETQENNGFIRMVKPTKIINGHCLTVSVNYASTVFYQEEDFCASVNIVVLRPKDNLTKNNLLFIAAILSKQHESYSYTDKVSKDLLMKDMIKLPAIYNTEKDEYEPDWNYIEEFFKYSKDFNKEKLDFLNNVKSSKNNINIDNWCEFELIKLFDIEQSKGDIQFQKCIAGDIPLVSSGNDMTNSVVGYIAEGDGVAEKFEGGNITIDMFGSANYQNNEFYAVSHGRVTILKPLYNKNSFISLFIVSCLNKKFKFLCSYNNMCTMTLLKKESIPLPAVYNEEKHEYEPDFEHMEEVIKKLMCENKRKLNLLNILYKIEDNKLCGDNFSFDTSNWYEFKITDIFNEIKRGGVINKKDIEIGEIPLVSSGNNNNGISCYIKNNDVLFTGECITLDMFGNAFFRDYPFYADNNVIVLKNDKISMFEMLYLTSVISKIIKKYKYQDRFNFSSIDKIKIPLPPLYNFKKRKYEPDWEQMSYMIRMMCDMTEFRLRRLEND